MSDLLQADSVTENGHLTELYGVKVGHRYRSKDKRDKSYVRTVLQVQMQGDGVPYAQLSGYPQTWIKIDTYKRTVSRYERY